MPNLGLGYTFRAVAIGKILWICILRPPRIHGNFSLWIDPDRDVSRSRCSRIATWPDFRSNDAIGRSFVQEFTTPSLRLSLKFSKRRALSRDRLFLTISQGVFLYSFLWAACGAYTNNQRTRRHVVSVGFLFTFRRDLSPYLQSSKRHRLDAQS